MRIEQQLLVFPCQCVLWRGDSSMEKVIAKLWSALGSLIHDCLPRVWVFETETSSYTLFLDTEDYACVPAADRDRDMTIHWREKALEPILASGGHNSDPPSDYPDVFVHTDKGRAAFNYLMKENGL